MPRRTRKSTSSRAEPVDPAAEVKEMSQRLLGPAGARLAGYEVRSTPGKTKTYRCPYCNGTIAEGQAHLVSLPSGEPGRRRHYHPGCWAKVVRSDRVPLQ